MATSLSLSTIEDHIQWIAAHSFGRTLHPWQVNCIKDLLHLSRSSNGSYPSAYLVVRPTGGGKSLVRDIAGRLLRGVTWTLCPLLVLAADQVESVNSYATNNNDAFFTAINLDAVKNRTKIDELVSHLTSLPCDTKKSFFIFSSPKAMITNQWMMDLFDRLLTSGLLRLFCNDEIHLSIRQSLFFRSEYRVLQDCLFNKLLCSLAVDNTDNNDKLKIVVLNMTATASHELIETYYPMLMLHHIPEMNRHWPSPFEMRRRNVFLQVSFDQHQLKKFKDMAKLYFARHLQKVILYHNFRSTLLRLSNEIKEWLAEENILVDVIPVHGRLSRDEKFYNIRVFTGKDTIEPPPVGQRGFYPRLLMATESANAGIDCSLVYFVFRMGIPESLFTFLQELGRAGRRPSASSLSDRYTASFQLSDYVQMIHRIHSGNNKTSADDSLNHGLLNNKRKCELAISDLNSVAMELTLPLCCFHKRFEWLSSNCCKPSNTNHESEWDIYNATAPPCNTHCSYCTGDSKPRQVNSSSLASLLFEIFLSKDGASLSLADEFPKTLSEMPNSSKRCYMTGREGSQLQISQVKILVLRLLSVGILEPVVKTKDGNIMVTTRLARNRGREGYYINNQDSWKRFKVNHRAT
jgi:superfamily II DNA helicase RecQ